MIDRGVNAGVHAITGFASQRNIALYLLFTNFEDKFKLKHIFVSCNKLKHIFVSCNKLNNNIMLIRNILLILSLLTVSCTTSNGYDSIEQLYEESLIVLKSNDEKKISEFVIKIMPDQGTINYMKKNDVNYRGFPKGLEEYPNALDTAIVQYTKQLKNYASFLNSRGILQDLQFVKFKRPLSPEPLDNKNINVLFEEPFAEFISPNNNIEISYKLGELLFIDGKWKVFTSPKLWYDN